VSPVAPVRRDAGYEGLLAATHAGEERVRADPFAAVELGLGALWIAPPAG